jgi:hypothetical protein
MAYLPDVARAETCPHARVAPRGISPAYVSFPVLSAELEFGSCQDCQSAVVRELGSTRWEPIPRDRLSA